MTETSARCPALSNIRICDFTGQLAGAGATKILAMFGAQVIRVEDRLRQGQWDIFRGNGPWPDERRGINLGGTFNNHNVEKMGVTLDMRKPEASDILRELISVSDVVAENFSKGVLDRWGLLLRGDGQDKAGHHIRVQLRLRTRGSVLRVQDMGAHRSGCVRPHVPVGACGYASGGLGILLHGSHRRLSHGDSDSDGSLSPPPHRRRPVGGYVLLRWGGGAERARHARLHRQRRSVQASGQPEQQSEYLPEDGPAWDIQVRRGGSVGRGRSAR